MEEKEKRSIVLFSPYPLLIQSLRAQFPPHSGWAWMAVRPRALDELPALLDEYRPDAAVVHVAQVHAALPSESRALLRTLRTHSPHLKILALIPTLTLPLLNELKPLNIQGCLLLDDELTLNLPALLSALCEGADVYSRPVAAALRNHKPTSPNNEENAEPLTARQMEILRLYVLEPHLTSEARAKRLGISVHTLRDHLKAISIRLEASSVLDITLKAFRIGVLPLDDLFSDPAPLCCPALETIPETVGVGAETAD